MKRALIITPVLALVACGPPSPEELCNHGAEIMKEEASESVGELGAFSDAANGIAQFAIDAMAATCPPMVTAYKDSNPDQYKDLAKCMIKADNSDEFAACMPE